MNYYVCDRCGDRTPWFKPDGRANAYYGCYVCGNDYCIECWKADPMPCHIWFSSKRSRRAWKIYFRGSSIGRARDC